MKLDVGGRPIPGCPAADPLAGPPGRGPAVVCRIANADGARLSLVDGEVPGALITAATDPLTLEGLCCGEGLPVVREGAPAAKGHQHFTACNIWQDELHQQWARERRDLLLATGEGNDPEPMALDDILSLA